MNTLSSRNTPIFLIFCLLTAVFCASCSSPSDKMYDRGSRGQTISVEKGDVFSLRLMGSTGTDARWMIVQIDENILEPRGEPRLDNSIPIGGLARVINYTFQFRCKAAGTCTLRLELQKADGTVLEEFSTTVDIKS